MSVKKVSKTRRKYDVAFKEDVLKMISSGRPISEVSQALGVSASLLHRWYKSAHLITPTPAKKGHYHQQYSIARLRKLSA